MRLINPAKNEVGRISKVILDKINNKLRDTLQVNQWKSTASVINCFRNIQEKNLHKFIIFDIKTSTLQYLKNYFKNHSTLHKDSSTSSTQTIRKSFFIHGNHFYFPIWINGGRKIILCLMLLWGRMMVPRYVNS